MKWVEIRKSGDYDAIAKKHKISPVIARILANKGINTDEKIKKYLYGTLDDMYSPYLMKDMETAVETMIKRMQEGSHICIIGDYDIDGVFSTYILYHALLDAGANVSYAVPHRVEDGYGINIPLIEKAINDGVTTIITCDNGIAAREAVSFARQHDMTVIITDHHEVPFDTDGEVRREVLPDADAVVDPKRSDCPYPCKDLCGAGVAYKFIQALYEKMNMPVDPKEYLPYVAFATIGDVVDLVDENRLIVKYGLPLMKKCNIGLDALMAVNNLSYDNITPYHVGFILGPCINATGRLDTARTAVELLITEDEARAKTIAEELYRLNCERKEMTETQKKIAFSMVEESLTGDKVLVLCLPECHESLCGIIAGKLREKYYKPSFVLTRTSSGCLKGSGRSIEAYSMFEKLSEVKDLLISYGGHPMAAGISLQEDKLEELRKKLNEKCALSEEDLTEKAKIDAVLPLDYCNEALIKQLELLEPCGKGNSKPLFAVRNAQISSMKVLGEKRNFVKMKALKSGNLPIETVYFTDGDAFLRQIEAKFGRIEKEQLLIGAAQHTFINLLYYPKINEFNGKRTVQVNVVDWC